MTSLVESLFPERFENTEHPRKVIREALHNRLKNPVNPNDPAEDQKYWTPAGPNVFANKELQIDFDDMPLVLLRYIKEEVQTRSISGWDGFDKRLLEMCAECYVTVPPGDSAEDKLDEMAFFIEACINGFDLRRYNCDVLLDETEYETEFDAAQPIAVGRLTFQITYLCPRLGVDFGLFDRDDACLNNDGLDPAIQKITLKSNFGTEVFDQPWEGIDNDD
jgi:hypothetical protein